MEERRIMHLMATRVATELLAKAVMEQIGKALPDFPPVKDGSFIPFLADKSIKVDEKINKLATLAVDNVGKLPEEEFYQFMDKATEEMAVMVVVEAMILYFDGRLAQRSETITAHLHQIYNRPSGAGSK